MTPPAAAANGELNLRAWAAEAEAAAGIARTLAPTPFVPDQLKVWQNPAERDPSKRVLDYEATVATVTAVLLAGQELGLKPMASLRSFTLIRGQVAMYSLAARALLQQRGHEIEVRESTDTRAIVDARRLGADQWQRSTWDVQRARTAKLLPGHPDGNWARQPKAMLVARATGEACRWVAADAMLGLPVLVEELEDASADGQEPRAIEAGSAAEPAPDGGAATATGRRARRKPAAGTRAELPTAPPPPRDPPDNIPPEPTPPAPKIAKGQRTRLHAALRAIGVTDRDEALGMISAWVGHPVTTTDALTATEGSFVIQRAESIREIARDDQADREQHEEVPPDAPEPE